MTNKTDTYLEKLEANAKFLNNLPKKSGYDIWSIPIDCDFASEAIKKGLVPIVLCNERYQVIQLDYLQVANPEEAETIMRGVVNTGYPFRSWGRLRRKERKEIAQKAMAVLKKYLI